MGQSREDSPGERAQAGNDGWLLAIDTSSDRAGIALYDGSDLYLRQWPCIREQTTQVPSAIHDLLSSARITLSDLVCVGVATGPGTFTGLRVGLSLAKGFSLGRSLPIVRIPTLEATAFPWTRIGVRIIAVAPAGRGRVVWQRFAAGDDMPPRNTTPAELISAVNVDLVAAVVGELPPSLLDQLGNLPIPIITGPESPARVGAIAALGLERHRRRDWDDSASLEPHYLHGIRAATQSVTDPSP